MQLEPISYMAWAKSHMEDPGVHNLGTSGIRNLLTMEDLAPLVEGCSIWGRNDDGLPALRERIADRMGVSARNVLLSEGASLANFLVLAAWLRPGDPVLLEEPNYEPLGSVLEGLGASVHRVAVDGAEGHQAVLDALRRTRRTRWRAAVITNPHNPSGTQIGEDLLTDLGAACEEQGGILLVDEAYREMLFEDPPGCAARGRAGVVTTSSLTKVFGLGPLRIGWAVGPEPLIERAIRVHDNLGVVHPFLTESIGEKIFADSDRLREWKERIRKRAEANREMLTRFYRGHPEFEGTLPAAGIMSFPRWRGTPAFPDAETLWRRAAEEAKIVFVPGRFYQRPDRLRIAVGGPQDAMRSALEAFDHFLSRAR